MSTMLLTPVDSRRRVAADGDAGHCAVRTRGSIRHGAPTPRRSARPSSIACCRRPPTAATRRRSASSSARAPAARPVVADRLTETRRSHRGEPSQRLESFTAIVHGDDLRGARRPILMSRACRSTPSSPPTPRRERRRPDVERRESARRSLGLRTRRSTTATKSASPSSIQASRRARISPAGAADRLLRFHRRRPARRIPTTTTDMARTSRR